MPELRRVTDPDVITRVRAAASAASAGVRKRVSDPILIEKVRRAAGLDPDERIDTAFSAADDVAGRTMTSRATALGRGAAQGATLGFYDELRGLGEAGGLEPDEPLSLGAVARGGYRRLTGGDEAGAYDAAVARERQRLDVARAERPGFAIAGEVGGALATAPFLPVARAVQGAGWTGRALASAKTGGAYGVAYGFGAGEGSFANRLREAALGGAVGFGAGGVVSPFADLALAGARSLYGGLRNLALPLRRRGRETMAGETIRDRATDVGAVRQSLQTPQELVPGSRPTTAQAADDAGLLQLERRVSRERPEGFVTRAEEQDVARRSALGNLQAEGYPQAVAGALRTQLSTIERMTDATIADFTAAARARFQQLGGDLNSEEYGDAIRSFAVSSRNAANRRRRSLYDAVDPTGRMVMPGTSIVSAAREVAAEVTPTAKPMAGEEAAIFNAARDLGERVRFSDIRLLRSRIGDAISEEERKAGQTQTWRRLKLLRGAVDRALDGITDGVARIEKRAAALGEMSPGATIGNRLAAASQGAAPNTGSTVFTPSGRRVDVDYEVVEADSLIPSHTPDMAPDPRFPAALQPRDRGRVASEVQVNRIASELQPERLGASTSAMDGAPIIGPDGIVESGNARVLGISRAYEAGGARADAYRQFLQAQGFDVAAMRAPVLVRRRVTPLAPQERVAFTQEGNVSTGLSLSATERAAMDGERIPDGLLDLYRGGDVSAAGNRDFIRGFLQAVGRPGEEGAFVTSGGALSQEGAQRVRGALLHAAYEDSPLVASLMENSDEGLRAFGGALSDVAGEVARLRRSILAGRVDPGADIGRAAVEAANLVKDARLRNVRLPDQIAQQDAFGQVSNDALEILRTAYGDDLRGRVSRERLTEALNDYILDAGKQTTDARLFGEPLSAGQILEGVRARYGGTGTVSDTLAAGDTPARPGAGALGNQGREFGASAGRSGNAEAGRSGAQIVRETDSAPSLDPAAVARLREANQFNREFKSTFDRGTMGSVLAGSGRDEYRILSSSVPQRILASGPRGFQTVQAYRQAVGDGEAMLVLQDYAASSLRAASERADGTLDPVKLARWRDRHGDALRAFPELDARFADAGRASEAIAGAAETRKAALDAFQKGVVGKLIGADDPETVVNVVGGIFGARDGMAQMRRLVTATRNNPDAREGLRKAAVDYMLRQFIGSNDALQSGMLQKFIRRNIGLLRQAFSETETDMMERIAFDLKRSAPQRGKVGGGSDSAQNLASGGPISLLGKMLRHATQREGVYGGAAGFFLGGPWGAALGAASAEAWRAMRQAGLAQVEDLIADAMLNPARARALLERVSDRAPPEYLTRLGRLYRNAAVFGSVQGAVGENAERAFDPESRTPSAVLALRRELEKTDPQRWAAVKRDYIASVLSDALGGVDLRTAVDALERADNQSPQNINPSAAMMHAALIREPVQANMKAALTPDEWTRATSMTVVLRRASSLSYLSNPAALRVKVRAQEQDAALPLLRKLSDAPNAIADIRALVKWASADAEMHSRALSELILSGNEEADRTVRELRRLSPWDKAWPVMFGHLLRLTDAFEEGSQGTGAIPMPQRTPLDLTGGLGMVVGQ